MPAIAFAALSLKDADFQLSQRGRTLRVAVPWAHFSAQVGAGAEHENWLDGDVTVWETTVHVPTPDDAAGLVPGYARDGFVKSFQCRADLQQPVSHLCPPPREQPAQAGAALSVKLFGGVA